MRKLVSVIIPVYNEEKYLKKCLRSLLEQSYKPLEIIVIDDGSTDRSVEIIKKFPVALLCQKHVGTVPARNLGASKTKGEILVFPDADMWFDKKYVENLIKPVLEGKVIATWTKEEYVANPENIWSQCWSIDHEIDINKRIPKDVPDEIEEMRAIVKREFDKVGGYSDLDRGGRGEGPTVLRKLGKKALAAKGAICYHFNPDSLKEVFLDAQWYGKSKIFGKSFKGFLWVSFPNSLRVGFLKAWKYKIPAFLLYKIIHDFGVSIGFVRGLLSKSHVK